MNDFSYFGSTPLDDTDRLCLAALQADPRGSWHALSENSGIAERTVARRIQRLIDDNAIRVIAELDPITTGQSTVVHLWMRCQLQKITQVAQHLSTLPQVSLVLVLAGSFDIFVELHLPHVEDMNHFITKVLPPIDGIERVESRLALKIFRQAGQWRIKPGQKDVSGEPQQGPAAEPLLAVEQKMVAVLRNKGRASISELAKAAGVSIPTGHRLLQGLIERKAVSFRVEIEPKLLGFPVEAVVSIQVSAGSTETLIAKLAEIPNTRCLVGTSGTFQLFWHVVCQDSLDLWRVTTQELAQLDGISLNDVSLMLQAYKRCGISRIDGRLMNAISQA